MAALVPPPGLGCNDCLAHMGKVKLVGENKFLQTSCRPSHASFGTAPGGEVEEARIAQARQCASDCICFGGSQTGQKLWKPSLSARRDRCTKSRFGGHLTILCFLITARQARHRGAATMASFSPPASSNEDARREEGEGAGEGFLQPLPATPIPDTTDSSVAPAGRWNLARFWPGGAGGFTTPAHAQPPVASDTGEAESVDGSRRDNAEEEHHAGSDSPQSRANPVSSEAQQPRRQWVIASDMYQVDEELAEAVTLTQEEMEMLLAHRSGLRQTGAKGGETPITGGVMRVILHTRRLAKYDLTITVRSDLAIYEFKGLRIERYAPESD